MSDIAEQEKRDTGEARGQQIQHQAEQQARRTASTVRKEAAREVKERTTERGSGG